RWGDAVRVEPSRVHALGEHLDHATLAGRPPSLEDHHDRDPGLKHGVLEVEQPILQRRQPAPVLGLRDLQLQVDLLEHLEAPLIAILAERGPHRTPPGDTPLATIPRVSRTASIVLSNGLTLVTGD